MDEGMDGMEGGSGRGREEGSYSFVVLPAVYPFSGYSNLDIGINVSGWHYCFTPRSGDLSLSQLSCH